jgi:DNA-binding NarL/FixJ family response regulator
VIGGSEGLDLLADAVAVADGTTARLELVESLTAHGAALRAAGDRTGARDLLAQALDLAERCGANRLVDDTVGELRRAGFRPRRHLLTGPDSLTLSERRVAELAAEGATNSDISQALFVSQKTVELHLTNVYRKLAVDGRHQLPTALATGDRQA